MRLSRFALAGALAGLLSAGAAFGQSGTAPGSVQRTAFEYNNYYAQQEDEVAGAKEEGVEGETPAQAGVPAYAEPEGPAPMPGAGTLLNPCCCLGEQWKLIDRLPCAKCNGINVAGWLAQSYTWNTSNPADRFNGPVTWTDRANDYELNQLYLFAEKATNTNGCGWDFGWRADVMFGTDYRFNTESGLETHLQFQEPKISTQRFYGTAFTQFYAEVAVDDVKIKIGHWYAPVGYEVVPTTGNFFPSLPYTFQYGEPFTMTGIIATWQINQNVSYSGGIMRGWDNFQNLNPHISYVGAYTEKFSDGASLAYAQTIGNEFNQNAASGANGSDTSFRYLQTFVYSRPLKQISENLTYVIQSDLGIQDRALLSGHTARWYGVNQYLFYKVSDCMTYGIRYEWFRDEEGYRVGGFLGTASVTNDPAAPLRGLSGARTGYVGNFFEITMGANYKYTANTMFRPYVRFDWYSGGTATATNPTNLRPFDNGTGNSQTLIGFDVITTY